MINNEIELKENMYVRTKDGIIDKVTIDYKGKCNSPNCNCKHVSCQYNYYDEVDIINASHNIIDLIEVGDYVNGQLVKHIAYFEGVEEPIKKLIFADEYHLIPTEVCEEKDIKSIVTKEQFEQMAYKVGE